MKNYALMLLLVAGLCGCQSPTWFTRYWKQEARGEAERSLAQSEQEVATPMSAGLSMSTGRSRGTSLDNVRENFRLGEEAFAANNFPQATMFFEHVLELQPDHVDAHHRLAILADMQQRYRDAERHYLTALAGDPTNAPAMSDLGYSYLLQGRFEESERSLQQARIADPSYTKAIANLGLLYGKQGNYDKALATFRLIGSEAEAQAKMAQLFPGGRHDSHDGRDQILQASANSPEWANGPSGSRQQAPMPQGEAQPSEETLKLKQQMEQARRDAQISRMARAPAAAQPPHPFAEYQQSGGHPSIHPSQLRDALSAIEQEGRSSHLYDDQLIIEGPPRETSRDAGNLEQHPFSQASSGQPATSHLRPYEPPQTISGAAGTESRRGSEPRPPAANIWPSESWGANGEPSGLLQDQGGPSRSSSGFGIVQAGQFAPQADQGQVSQTQFITGPAPQDRPSTDAGQAGLQGWPQSQQQRPSLAPPEQPRTAQPLLGGQQALVPAGRDSTNQRAGLSNANPQQQGQMSYDEAKRHAAAVGMSSGSGQMFPLTTQTTQRQWPGSESRINGAMYPPVGREWPSFPVDQDPNPHLPEVPDMTPPQNSMGQPMPPASAHLNPPVNYRQGVRQFETAQPNPYLPSNPHAGMQPYTEQYRQQNESLNSLSQQVQESRTVSSAQGVTPGGAPMNTQWSEQSYTPPPWQPQSNGPQAAGNASRAEVANGSGDFVTPPSYRPGGSGEETAAWPQGANTPASVTPPPWPGGGSPAGSAASTPPPYGQRPANQAEWGNTPQVIPGRPATRSAY